MKIRVVVFRRADIPQPTADGSLLPHEWEVDAAARILKARFGYTGGFFTETYSDSGLKVFLWYPSA